MSVSIGENIIVRISRQNDRESVRVEIVLSLVLVHREESRF